MSREAFESYYKKIYGDRWELLLKSLLSDEKRCSRMNLFSNEKPSPQLILQEFVPYCYPDLKAEIPRSENGLLQFYVMDPASVFAAEQLDLKAGQRVLDMCAAPGGKSLILAQNLFKNESPVGELILNELSDSRRERLKKVVQNYIPDDVRKNVWIKGKDGALYGMKEPDSFDRILLDAPCSGERHLLENESEISQWSPKRTQGLSQKQYSLLVSALMALKSEGELVYSTCSISPLENDEVIDHLIKKKSKKIPFEIQNIWLDSLNEYAEKTKHGVFFSPDRFGFGPMYVCRIRKN